MIGSSVVARVSCIWDRRLQHVRDGRVRALLPHAKDLSAVVIAIVGVWFFWSQCSQLSALSWWYENTQDLRERTAGLRPDYDLASLPWQVTRPPRFEMQGDRIEVVTGGEPFAYQAFATIDTGGAGAVDIAFDVDVESGGVTIGLQQQGRWIAMNSTRNPGPFVEGNSARLSFRRSATVVIANNNPAGESRLTVKSLGVFLRK